MTLLGTGTPNPRPDRFGPSVLVEAGDKRLVLDAGRGLTIRLFQIGVPLGTIDSLFITHFHSDHLNGLPDYFGYTGEVPAQGFHVLKGTMNNYNIMVRGIVDGKHR